MNLGKTSSVTELKLKKKKKGEKTLKPRPNK